MKIVRIQGGLGNQMFQFAFGETLRNIYNWDIFYDISFFNNQNSYLEAGNSFRKFDLVEVFPQINNFLVRNKLLVENEPENTIYNKILRRFTYQLIGLKLFKWISDSETGLVNFNSKPFLQTNIYLSGYWQNWRYFAKNEGCMRSFFEFDRNIVSGQQNLTLLSEIKENISAAIHIRRGDYLNSKYFNNNRISYYIEGMKHIMNIHPTVNFYLFTDDIQWVIDNLGRFKAINSKTSLVSASRLDVSLEMYLMSQCQHSIISNSTFGWWAAFLNNYPNKILVAPENWTNSIEMNKFIREGLLETFCLL
jgi:hypothetical protein